MAHRAQCGPGRDPEFFKDLTAVFAKHPDSSRRYSVRRLAAETEVLGVDFTKQVGVSRIEGDRIVTEFPDMEKAWRLPDEPPPCCEWIGDPPDMRCVKRCVE